MTLESWLAGHPYLNPLAHFHSRIESVLARFSEATLAPLDWDAYSDDFHGGIPLLRSSQVHLDLKPAENILKSLVAELTLETRTIAEQCEILRSELDLDTEAPRRVIAALVARAPFESSCPDLLRFLGWAALSKYLHPVVIAFSHWRDDEKWVRTYCPTCGSDAAMAQLLGAEQGRRRFLCCGRCSTRWQYRRTGCPFCRAEDDHNLRALAIEGEAALRIDYCEHCHGYLKTYAGEGHEDVLLANWTSLHLDLLARDKELQAFAESVYLI